MIVVLVFTILLGILIWRQSFRIEKKALIAKQRQEEYLQQLEAERQMQLQQNLENQSDELNNEISEQPGK
jgi:predicted Holliday junction resolvase-like endonuclease